MYDALPLLAFVFGSLLIARGRARVHAERGRGDRPAARRADARRSDASEATSRGFQSLIGLFKRVGEKVPRSPKEMGTLRLRLVQAGYRREEAITIFFGIRVMFALALFCSSRRPSSRART